MAKKTKSQPNKSQKSTVSKIKDSTAFKINTFKKTQFKILNNNDAMTKMSSEDLLIIAHLLEKETASWVTEKKSKLNMYIKSKIKRTEKKEIEEDKNFEELKQYVIGRKNKQAEKMKKQNASKQRVSTEPKAEKKKEGWFKRKWKAIKRGLVVAGIATAGLLSGMFSGNNQSAQSDNTPKQDKVEQTITPPKTETTKNITQVSVGQEFSTAQDSLSNAYKDRFDSALEIHLGAEKRDALYQKIDELAKNGKIEYKDGTTKEWYAHAFTMYAEIAPFSEEAQAIGHFLRGDDVKPEVLHDLVVKSKRDGTGVQGNGTHSNFDKVSPELQKKHVKNRHNVTSAEQHLQILQQQKTR